MLINGKNSINEDSFGDHPLSLEFQDSTVQIPLLPLLPGESPLIIQKVLPNDCIIITDYRLMISNQKEMLYLIPNYLIWKLEYIELIYINIITKHGLTFKLKFPDSLISSKCFNKLSKLISIPQEVENLFAFKFYKALKNLFCDDNSNCPFLQSSEHSYDICKEFSRMKFSDTVWYISDLNKDFKLCTSYPEYHILPKSMTPTRMRIVAEFRSCCRFPSVVWRSQKTGAVIFRCSQPCVGIMFWRNEEDENFAKEILNACEIDCDIETSSPKGARRLLIVDARNYHAAQLNRFKGGGFEFVDYYERTDINFMGLPNIHTVRDSFEKLTTVFNSKSEINWMTSMEKTVWLGYLSQLLRSSIDVATAVHVKGWPVMVHCTDGWDRTPQLVSLAQILLDPYYRTIQISGRIIANDRAMNSSATGFRVLVQKEWLDFGHKFADRCGHGVGSINTDERCPIFLQWLDCVHQIHRQFPEFFQFNDTFLLKMCHHVYSTLFGTFLCNTLKERHEENLSIRTASVWNFLNESSNYHIINYTYRETHEMLCPQYQQSSLSLWCALFKSPPERWSQISSGSQPAGLILCSDNSVCNVSPTLRRSQSDAELSASSSSLTSCPTCSEGVGSEATSELVNSHHVRSQSLTLEEQLAAASASVIKHSSDVDHCSENSRDPAVGDRPPCESMPVVDTELLTMCTSQTVPRLSELSERTMKSLQRSVSLVCNRSDASVNSFEGNGTAASISCDAEDKAADVSCTAPVHPLNLVQLQSLEASITSTLKDNPSGSSRSGSPDSSDGHNSSISSNYSSSHSPSPSWQASFFQNFSLRGANESAKLNSSKIHSDVDYDGIFKMNNPITEFIHSKFQLQQKLIRKRNQELVQLKRKLEAEKEKQHTYAKTYSSHQENCRNSQCGSRSSSESSQVSGGPHDNQSDTSIDPAAGISVDFDKIQVEQGYTCWVPDHMVSACCQCTVTFSLRFRRHHCRSCGNVFCGSCSNFFLPLPEQQINRQVRLCQSCYVSRRQEFPDTITPPPNPSPLSGGFGEVEQVDLAEEATLSA